MRLFEKVAARAERAGALRVREAIDAVEASVREAGLAVERTASGLVVVGRGLTKKFLSDPRLRFSRWRGR